jgi:predicted metal-dependent enzyme (double-stranded beta helix superfamily)
MLTPAQFTEQCIACAAGGGTPADVQSLMQHALAAQAAEPAAWDVDELMHRSAGLLIVNLTLPPFAVSPVHDHGAWAVIGISAGCEIEHFYASAAGTLQSRGHVVLTPGQTVALDPDAIHAIANPLAVPARGLHVYGTDLVAARRRMWDPRSGEERAFEAAAFERWADELTARARSAHWPP